MKNAAQAVVCRGPPLKPHPCRPWHNRGKGTCEQGHPWVEEESRPKSVPVNNPTSKATTARKEGAQGRTKALATQLSSTPASARGQV